MPNEKLVSTLRETRNEIVYERYARMGRLDKAQRILEDSRLNLKQAQDQERVAVQADEDVKEKQRVLIDSLNGMSEKPQYLLDKIGRLQGEQLTTYRARQIAQEIARSRQREVTQAETALAVAQMDMQAIDKDIADIDSKIQEAQARL
jgi:ethanolamine utilization cobalamin adenosyltransferase